MPGMNCLSETDYTQEENRGSDMPTYFRTGTYLPIGVGVSVGTSYSIEDKVKKIALLLAYCNEPKEIFEPEDEYVGELLQKNYDKYAGGSTSGISRRGGGSEERYKIYGEEYTGV